MAKERVPAPCAAIMKSQMIENHVHSCDGHHDEDDCHWCPECKRWWWEKTAKPRVKGK